MRRSLFIGLASLVLAASAALGPSAAQAQGYPSRPIRLVVPYGVGGPSDIVARVIANEMDKSLGQTVVVDNKPGAGSMLGTEQVVRAPADGYTLLLTDLPVTIVPHVLRSSTGFDPTRDMEPIALIGGSSLQLYVGAQVPARTLAEFVALAKNRPSGVRIASGGNGTLTHLLAEVFAQSAGFPMTHVPYQGTGPAMPDLLAGRVDAMFNGYLATAGYLGDGRVRPLATAAAVRAPELSSVPTFAELGYPAVTVTYWLGLAAPARLPQTVSDALRAALQKAITAPAVASKFASLAITPATDTSRAAMKAAIDSDYQRWGAVVRERGITVN
jgi:tripartite-type tricarboxylate transporter receptor subunit TctC